MVNNSPRIGNLLLALGSNMPGRWGAPHATMTRALSELKSAGIKIVCVSGFYETEPVGSGRQPPYLNAVVAARAGMPPAHLLRLLKSIERGAGRRLTPPLQPRPIDIDILDYAGRRLNWPAPRRERGRLVLPHPLLHVRPFVLVPLLDVAPHWSHPVLAQGAKALLARIGPRAAGRIRRRAFSA